ncbi:MAG: HEPN domain-containing protein [Endomicrobia bacterium]|nr:HEPN domain-containing protein [Endomicrobiia bacterium]MDW8056528.1 HEPN domain-containing protein [Elusimicrobiota bacterium]
MNKMNKDIEGYLKKAEDSIRSAELNLLNELYDFSVSRSYYAMFYIAEALLLSKKLSYSSHSAVISFFNKEFVKTKIFDKKYFDYLTKAFELRQNSDYEPQPVATREQAQDILQKAKEFLKAAKKYLKR